MEPEQELLSMITRLQNELDKPWAVGNEERNGAFMVAMADLVSRPGVPPIYSTELERVRADNFEILKVIERSKILEKHASPSDGSNEEINHTPKFIEWERQELQREACRALLLQLQKTFEVSPKLKFKVQR